MEFAQSVALVRNLTSLKIVINPLVNWLDSQLTRGFIFNRQGFGKLARICNKEIKC